MTAIITLPQRFEAPDLLGWLEAASLTDMDHQPFGIIGMAPDATVEHYNLTESKLAGLSPERVIGRHFFVAVAPCMNNFLVAHRFETEPQIDDVIDYVLTFRVAPVKVRLRLMKHPDARRMYILIERC